MNIDKIIIEPVLTEKTNSMREGNIKKYTFKVDKRANKLQIMEAVEKLFSVKTVACHVSIVKKKPRMSRSKSGPKKGYTTSWKKAIITLRTGEKIDIIEGI